MRRRLTWIYTHFFEGIPWWGWAIYIFLLAILVLITSLIIALIDLVLDIPLGRVYTTSIDWYTNQYDPFLYDGMWTLAASIAVMAVLWFPLVGLPYLGVRAYLRRRRERRRMQQHINRSNIDELNREIEADLRRNLRRA